MRSRQQTPVCRIGNKSILKSNNCIIMKINFFVAAMAAMAVVGCVREETLDTQVGTGDAVAVADDMYVERGWVRVKLAGDAEPLRVGAYTRGAFDSGNAELDRIAAQLGATEIRRTFRDGGKFAERRRKYGLHLWYDIRFDETVPVSRASGDIASLPGIEHVQPVYKAIPLNDMAALPGDAVYTQPVMTTAAEAHMDDPELSKQWHYHNDGSLGSLASVPGADINLFGAWEAGVYGNPDVIVAVTDGGVQYDHPDLAANMWVNEAERDGTPGVDDDNNGFVDDIYGYNFATDSGTIEPVSHGTHVAGTVAAVNNNGEGVCGVAGGSGNGDGARIMSCQVVTNAGSSASNLMLAEAYVYAAENGAVISQNSWSNSNMATNLPEDLSVAFDYFIECAGFDENGVQTGPMAGGMIIFAAGNNSMPDLVLPASDPRVIAVTAMNPDYTKARYSNYGVDADIFAPGGADMLDTKYPTSGQVYSTDLNGSYGYQYGTSMACPHVSGVVALIVSEYGGQGFTADECRMRLLGSYKSVADYVDPSQVDKLGVGLVDAGMITLSAPATAPGDVTAYSSSVVAGNNVDFEWTTPVDGNGNSVAEYLIVYEGQGIGKFEGRTTSGEITIRNYEEAGETATHRVVMGYNMSYTFTVYAIDRFGNRSTGVEMVQETGDYENERPRVAQQFENMHIADVGSENIVRMELSEYFTDANMEMGDVLTYTYINRNEAVLNVSIEDNVLIIEPIAKGQANVTVTATDMDGEQAQSAMIVYVDNGPEPAPEPDVETGDGLSLYPNPATSTLHVSIAQAAGARVDIAVYDGAARRVLTDTLAADENGGVALDIASLSPGVYTITVSVGAAEYGGSFIKG